MISKSGISHSELRIGQMANVQIGHVADVLATVPWYTVVRRSPASIAACLMKE
jgi:hypothetical protein